MTRPDLSDTEIYDPDPEDYEDDKYFDFRPDDWELYQRMADCGSDLALDLKRLLFEKKYQDAYHLLAAEHVLVVAHVIDEFRMESSLEELNNLRQGMLYVLFRRMEDLECKAEIVEMSHAINSLLRQFTSQAAKHIRAGLAHQKGSRKGTDQLRSQTEEKHRQLLSRASAMRKLNPRLSKSRIATFLRDRGETDYRQSTILAILKDLGKTDM